MVIIKKQGGEHLVFEHSELNILVAIDKTDQSVIKKYWKKYKGKQDLPDEVVKGYPFVYNETQESLVIDFTEIKTYHIKKLVKFD